VTREGAQELRHAIAQSLGSQPQVIILRLVEGLSRKQVSQILGKSDGAGWAKEHPGLRSQGTYLADPKNRRPKAQTVYGVPVVRDLIAASRKQAKDLLTTPRESQIGFQATSDVRAELGIGIGSQYAPLMLGASSGSRKCLRSSVVIFSHRREHVTGTNCLLTPGT
jgi:hypothetical protein